ncbi:MAG: hypothetical protein MUF51_06030 [Vicinamibacteria bacterium]|nr:hypothetical protein [Vicinamibacteria bacterium]
MAIGLAYAQKPSPARTERPAPAASPVITPRAPAPLGPPPRLPETAKVRLPTLFLIGDSTVRNGQGDGRNGQWGRGEPTIAYFDQRRINVVSRAIGGRSARTYLNQGQWERTLALVKQVAAYQPEKS